VPLDLNKRKSKTETCGNKKKHELAEKEKL
jgi:hypothetical protein